MQTSEPRTLQTSADGGLVELRVRDLSDLLIASPPPFKGTALTPDAESYIVQKAKRLPARQPIGLPIESAKPLSRDLGPTLAAYFSEAAEAERQNVRELFRGRQSDNGT